jgi:hypothetical protein
MDGYVRDGGVWKPMSELYVRDGGIWKPAEEAWVRDGGIWKQWFLSAIPSPQIARAEALSGTTDWQDSENIFYTASANFFAYIFDAGLKQITLILEDVDIPTSATVTEVIIRVNCESNTTDTFDTDSRVGTTAIGAPRFLLNYPTTRATRTYTLNAANGWRDGVGGSASVDAEDPAWWNANRLLRLASDLFAGGSTVCRIYWIEQEIHYE